MILSKNQTFSDAQAIIADAASSNILDFGPVHSGLARMVGKGEPVPMLVKCVEDFNNLTSMVVSLQFSDDPAFGGTPQTAWTSGAILLAALKAGLELNIDYIPRAALGRYARIFYDITGTAPTTGKMSAFITTGHQTNG